MKERITLLLVVLSVGIWVISSSIVKAGVVHINHQGEDDVWRDGRQLDLKYCISSDFNYEKGQFYDQVKADVEAAGKEWAKVANVNFRYVSGYDDLCQDESADDLGLDFAVRRHDDNSYPSSSSYPYTTGDSNRNIYYNPALDPPYTGWSQKAVFMHEMGHFLGLFHEHERPDAPDTNPGTGETVFDCCQYSVGLALSKMRPITEYDENSIMAYPYEYNYGAWPEGNVYCPEGESIIVCNVGVGDGYGYNSSLSELDGYTMRELYGAPASWFVVYGMLLQ